MFSPANLIDLPVELIADIYLEALSASFPHTCKYIYTAIKSLPPSIHARYIYYRHDPRAYYPFSPSGQIHIAGEAFTRALRYPICTTPVLKATMRLITNADISYPNTQDCGLFDVPNRLFRPLNGSSAPLDETSDPLPFLRLLWQKDTGFGLVRHLQRSHSSYSLIRAVRARFTPLVRLLLDHGADPGKRNSMAVMVAISTKDLTLVKMLIEPQPKAGAAKEPDRVAVNPLMLDLAVRCDARDIVRYFMEEKGCVPNMTTLKAIGRSLSHRDVKNTPS